MSGIDWSKAPEGATHYREGVATFYKQTDRAYEWSAGRWQLIANDLNEFRWSDQLIARPSPAWSGEVLPPAGTECEYSPFKDSWHPVKVFALNQNGNGSTSALFERELANALAGCTIKPTVVPGFTQVAPRPLRSSRVDPETRLVRKHYGIPAGIARDLEREQKEAAQIRAMVESLEVVE